MGKLINGIMKTNVEDGLMPSANAISSEINDMNRKINENEDVIRKAFEENGLKPPEFNKEGKNIEPEKKDDYEVCIASIQRAISRYTQYERCNYDVLLSYTKLLDQFIHRQIDGKMKLHDMSLDEFMNFVNNIISIISMDMMLFQDSSLEWEEFLNSFCEILEDSYRLIINNIKLLLYTLRKCRIEKNRNENLSLDFDGDTTIGYNQDTIAGILIEHPL